MLDIQSLLHQISSPIVVVFPHPDDETVMAGGLMQRAVSLGKRVVSITLTRGEAGQLHVHGGGLSIAALRKRELEQSLELLGVDEFYCWNYGDGRLSLWQAWQQPLTELLSELHPGLVVTYDPSGISGHPDHIAVSLFIDSWQRSNSHNSQVLHPSFDSPLRDQILLHTQTGEFMTEPTHVLELDATELANKRQAILAHQSQNLSKPLNWLSEKKEWFHLHKPGRDYPYQYVAYDLGD